MRIAIMKWPNLISQFYFLRRPYEIQNGEVRQLLDLANRTLVLRRPPRLLLRPLVHLSLLFERIRVLCLFEGKPSPKFLLKKKLA